MAEHYEDRHCALREAEVATKSRSLGLSDEHIAAVEAVDAFEARTGPLVDDLVAAVREVRSFYATADVRFAKGHPQTAMFDKLAALDEASRG